MWAEVRMQNIEIIRRLQKLEKGCAPSSIDDSHQLIKPFLPLTSTAMVDDFNVKLRDKAFEAVFVSISLHNNKFFNFNENETIFFCGKKMCKDIEKKHFSFINIYYYYVTFCISTYRKISFPKLEEVIAKTQVTAH